MTRGDRARGRRRVQTDKKHNFSSPTSTTQARSCSNTFYRLQVFPFLTGPKIFVQPVAPLSILTVLLVSLPEPTLNVDSVVEIDSSALPYSKIDKQCVFMWLLGCQMNYGTCSLVLTYCSMWTYKSNFSVVGIDPSRSRFTTYFMAKSWRRISEIGVQPYFQIIIRQSMIPRQSMIHYYPLIPFKFY